MRSPCVSHPITEPQIDDNYELLCRLWSPVVGAEEGGGGAVDRGFQRVNGKDSDVCSDCWTILFCLMCNLMLGNW